MEVHRCKLAWLSHKEEKPLLADKSISGGEEVRQVQGSSWMLSPKPGPPRGCPHNLLERLQASARLHKDSARPQRQHTLSLSRESLWSFQDTLLVFHDLSLEPVSVSAHRTGSSLVAPCCRELTKMLPAQRQDLIVRLEKASSQIQVQKILKPACI